MAALQRLCLAAVLVAGVFGAGYLGAFASLDKLTLDARFGLTNRPASGQVVFLDIDSSSLAQVGVWPWSRRVHAELLDRLMALGAAEVAFDIDFSANSTPAEDAAFAAALDSAGGYAMLAAFLQVEGATGAVRLTQPAAQFLAHAGMASVNVLADNQGLIDRFPVAIESGGSRIPALPAALFGREPSSKDVYIDYGIDLRTVDRIPAGDLLAGRVEAARIVDRQVVVGASAIELRDTFNAPRYGVMPGPLLQIAGLETLKAGRALVPLGIWPALASALVLVGIWVAAGTRISVAPAAAAGAGLVIAVEVLAGIVQWQFGIVLQTASFHVLVLALLGGHVALAFATEYAARRKAQARLLHLARHDAATDALSRRGLIERMESGAYRTVILVGVLRLDVVRVALGQQVADGASRVIAARLERMRLGTLAAIDGDVFAIALTNVPDPAEIEALGDRLHAALRPGLRVDGHDVHVDAVVAAHLRDDAASAEDFVRRAELALRVAKRMRRAGVTRFEPAMETEVDQRRRIDAALRRALESGELAVVFQPQVRLSDGELVGVEALVRWTSDELGAVSPIDFIPLAEETGLIVPLGSFVLKEACRLASGWNWSGRVGVNVSPAQLRLSDVGEMVADTLIETGFDPGRLDLEITESAMVDGPERVARAFDTLRALGLGVAIDDFGTGYSSLSYLSSLEFDKIKIDQSFVRGLEVGSRNAAIVQSTIELARRLGKVTVAEGIETDAQLQLLRRLGCDIGQGYLIGRPMSAEEIVARIEGERVRIPG